MILLISVTTFFRDRQVFNALAGVAIKPLFDGRDADRPIRIWVVGCASGEEAYSLGMLLLEEAARHPVSPPVQIFATDLDDAGLATARVGRYPKAIEADVPEERLRRFFVAEGTYYRVRKELRDLVLFAAQCAQGPALHQAGSDRLPQPADLPATRYPNPALRTFSLCAETGWILAPRLGRDG
jgi:two-component system, chemotaxis family, CheB/CheR fusion protein